MNLEHLTVEEIVQYIEAGVVDSIPAFIVLKFAEEIDKLNKTIEEESYDKGWNEALNEIVRKARMMEC